MENDLYKILSRAIEHGASDVHLTDRIKPILRIDGELFELAEFDVCNSTILTGFTEELLSEDNLAKFLIHKNVDSSFEYSDMRFRVHIYRQRGCNALSLRLVPKDIPSITDINLPDAISDFIQYKNGLILVTGVTGSGKSTTLASLIKEINLTQRKHIITIEDPIEYVHEHGASIINQREIGTDVSSFSDAVKAAMREDPDILLVGEMRDIDTMSNAITMAETGHLVFGTLHTRSVGETINRIIDVFPSAQQEQIRVQLANSIKGIVSQELLPKVGGGRVPLCEILKPDDGMRSLIREQASLNAMMDHMYYNAKKTGSISRIDSLAMLISKGLIKREVGVSLINEEDVNMLNNLIAIHDRK